MAIESIEDYPPLQTGMVAIGPDGTTTYVYQPPGLVPPITPPPTIDGYPKFVTMGVGIDPDGVVWQYAPTQPGGIVEVTPPPVPPVNTVRPIIQIISGNPVPGQSAINSNPGQWVPPQTQGYRRQWYLTGVAIPGATTNQYVIQTGDIGGVLQCGVIAIGDGGPSAEALSNSLTVVDPTPPEDPEARLDDNGGAQSRSLNEPAPKRKAPARRKR